MVKDLAIYTIVHQPRRLKLPAQPIPRGASSEDIAHCLFDERMNEQYFKKVAHFSYYPAAHMFLKLVRQGMKFSIGFSLSFIRQAALWDPDLLNLFRELVAEENVELIGVDPYHSFLCLLDLPTFVLRMQWMAGELERIFGKKPLVTDTSEMMMSSVIYNALDTAGFQGVLMDGRPWVLDWRASTHLYQYADERPYPLPIAEKQVSSRGKRSGRRLVVEAGPEHAPYMLTRHLDLSDDVGYRFSNTAWSGFPLFADVYANWIANTAGDLLLLGWDFETFGEHHAEHSGIFDFINALPGELYQRGVATYTPSQLIERHKQHTYQLPLPNFPTTWAGSGGLEFFLGNKAQETVFQLMSSVYGQAKLTENPDLIDLAIWLSQSDNLHLIQWFGRTGAEAEVSQYFTPREWWSLGSNRLIYEQQQVYHNMLRAMEPYLPVRQIRRSRRKAVTEPILPMRELELSHVVRHG